MGRSNVYAQSRSCRSSNSEIAGTVCNVQRQSQNVTELENALRASAQQLAALGRKCADSYEATRSSEKTCHFWHRQATELQEELAQARRECKQHWEVSEENRKALRQKEEELNELQTAL